jgi:hypothetical protein
MKINKKDLEPSIVEKVEQFDKLRQQFTSEDKSGFVAFNGEEFYVKRINDLLIKGIFTEKDIEFYENHLYSEGANEKNSFNSYINSNNIASSSFKALAVKPVEEILYKFTSDIVLIAKSLSVVYVLTEKGALVRYNLAEKKHEQSFDVLSYIRSNFAVVDISIHDFLSIEIIPGGLLLSTKNNGVFFYDSEKKTLEIRFVESGVVSMKYLSNEVILLGIDRVENNLIFFNINGEKIETSSILKRKLYQMPYLLESFEDNLLVVGRPYGINTTKDIVHYWKKDKANISFNNHDGRIFPGLDKKNYLVKHLSVTKTNAYLSGLKDDGKLFVWQYDFDELEKPFKEIIFDRLSLTDLSFVDMTESYFIAGVDNNLYFLNANGNVEKNLKLSEPIKTVSLIEFKDEFFYISKDKIILVKIPEYSDKEVLLDIYSSELSCNNIDVYVKSSTGKEKIAFFDTDTLTEIVPFYYVSYRGNIIIKLLESTAKKISMKIGIPKDSGVEGVVISANRLFMK